MRALLIVVCVVAASWSLGGCGSARRGEPFARPVKLDEKQALGQRVFMRHCNHCHPQGEGGLGPALNNKPLPSPAMKLQIRKGLGAMPGFDAQYIPDEELDALVAYLLELQTPSR